ncbi:MAG: sugar phosphate nucleotidyltransferase [Candidatus Methanodesulfokora sp.]
MVVSVIMAGGSGTRLWPLSRRRYPKQFIKLFNDRSLFQETFLRAKLVSDEVIVVTTGDLEFMVRGQVEELGYETRVFLEPAPRDNGVAIYFSLLGLDDDEAVLFMPSDHRILGDDFISSCKEAVSIAERDGIAVIGVRPRYPDPNLGYMRKGERISDRVCRVSGFVEKPEEEELQRLMKSGDYLWNTAIFASKPRKLKEEYRKHRPDVVDLFSRGVEEAYKLLSPFNFYAEIMGRMKDLLAVEGSFFWSDLGSFDSLDEMFEKDKDGNSFIGNVVSVDTRNSFIMSRRLTAVIGLSDIIVVDAGDALLVCPKRESHRVKEIVNLMNKRGMREAVFHITEYFSWGNETLMDSGRNYMIKRVVISPGKSLKKHIHYHRNEHVIVLSGTAELLIGERKVILRPGESTFIPAGVEHSVRNPGLIQLSYLDTFSGELIDEKDEIYLE